VARDTWRIGPGDRIGWSGERVGQDTLLRLLAGELEPETGRRVQGQTVRLAYLTQELQDLPRELRVLERWRRSPAVVIGKQELSASMLLSASVSRPGSSGRRSASCPAVSSAGCS